MSGPHHSPDRSRSWLARGGRLHDDAPAQPLFGERIIYRVRRAAVMLNAYLVKSERRRNNHQHCEHDHRFPSPT